MMMEDDDDTSGGLASGQSFCCPLCSSTFSSDASKWQHINLENISRLTFPSLPFLSESGRNLCSVCGFCYSKHWKVCRRSQGSGRGRCGGQMVVPAMSPWLSKMASVSDADHVADNVVSHMVQGINVPVDVPVESDDR